MEVVKHILLLRCLHPAGSNYPGPTQQGHPGGEDLQMVDHTLVPVVEQVEEVVVLEVQDPGATTEPDEVVWN